MAARVGGATGRGALDSVAATATRLVRNSAETSASGLENMEIITKTPPSQDPPTSACSSEILILALIRGSVHGAAVLKGSFLDMDRASCGRTRGQAVGFAMPTPLPSSNPNLF